VVAPSDAPRTIEFVEFLANQVKALGNGIVMEEGNRNAYENAETHANEQWQNDREALGIVWQQ
jgi:hypothetical protein